MSWIEAGFAFFVLWWIVLLMVLPIQFGDKQHQGGLQYQGIPENPRLAIKFALTTLVTAVITVLLHFVILFEWINLKANAVLL